MQALSTDDDGAFKIQIAVVLPRIVFLLLRKFLCINRKEVCVCVYIKKRRKW